MGGEVLASWTDGAAKRAVVEFVTGSAIEGSSRFVPESERIAAFDNDGTLWVEQPAPVQTGLLLGKLVEQVKADPALAAEEPYRAIVSGDEAFLKALAQQVPEAVESFLVGVGKAWEGTTPEEYEAEVRAFLEANQHGHFERPFTDLVYQPMLELFDLLRVHGWRIYVCSGGGRDFMRVIAEDTWGILRENVIGSAPEFGYENGRLVRRNELHGPIALGAGKPEHIFARTGRLPRFAAGNGDVDIEMLEVADFSLVIVHDDPEREYAYTAAAENLVAAAEQGDWTTVSMKNDWEAVFEEGTKL